MTLTIHYHMKKISFQLFPFLLALLFVFPILKENWSSIIVILICLNTIVYKIASKDYSWPGKISLVLTVPFWIILLRSIFTTNWNESAVHIQHALFFLILPLFFFFIPKEHFTKEKIALYLKVLKYTCLTIAIIYVVSFFTNYSVSEFFIVFQNVSSFRNYVYFDFTLFKIHPTYYTTLLVFCTAHSFDLVLQERKYSHFLFVVAFLLISIMLLTRLNIVLLVLTLTLMVFLRSKLNIKQMLLLSGGILGLTVVISLLTPGIKHRFIELYHSYNVKPENVAYDSTNIRKAIFDCSVAITKENFWFGVGFENIQNELNTCYQNNYDSSFYDGHNYMTHNYFLYILASGGIFCLALFLFYLSTIVRIAWKSKDFLFKVFLINVMLIWFIEDYLYRHYGLLYFNLLLICFIRYTENQTAEKKPKAKHNTL